jgi:hypothetical protein
VQGRQVSAIRLLTDGISDVHEAGSPFPLALVEMYALLAACHEAKHAYSFAEEAWQNGLQQAVEGINSPFQNQMRQWQAGLQYRLAALRDLGLNRFSEAEASYRQCLVIVCATSASEHAPVADVWFFLQVMDTDLLDDPTTGVRHPSSPSSHTHGVQVSHACDA